MLLKWFFRFSEIIRNQTLLKIIFGGFIFSLFLLNESGFLTFEFGFTIYPSYIMAFILLIILFYVKMKNKDFKFLGSGVDLPFLILVIVLLFSVIQSRFILNNEFVPMSSSVSIFTRDIYFRSVTQVFSIVFMMVIFYLVFNIVREKKALIDALNILIISATIACVFSLAAIYVCHFLKSNVFLNKYFSLLILDEKVSGPRGLRLRGFSPEPLIFGTYLVSVLPVTLSACFSRYFKKALIIPSLIIQSLTLFLTFSRSGWLALFFALFTFLLLNLNNIFSFIRKNKLAILILAITAIILAAAFNMFTGGRLVCKVQKSKLFEKINYSTFGQIAILRNIKRYSEASKSDTPELIIDNYNWGTMMRINDIVAGLNMFKEHPFLGVGWGNYIYQYLRYDPQIIGWWWIKWPETGNRPGTPVCCNFPATIFAECGILGILAFAFLAFRIIDIVFKGLAIALDRDLRIILAGLFSSLTAIFICYQFFSTFYYPFIWVVLGFTIATVRIITAERSNAQF